MSLNSVKNYFKQYNMDTHIVEFPVSSATVELAAQAIGCKEQEIAKTMSFHVGACSEILYISICLYASLFFKLLIIYIFI